MIGEPLRQVIDIYHIHHAHQGLYALAAASAAVPVGISGIDELVELDLGLQEIFIRVEDDRIEGVARELAEFA